MTVLLICPPVTPYSSKKELLDWRTHLEALALKYRNDEHAMESVRRALAEVDSWLLASEN